MIVVVSENEFFDTVKFISSLLNAVIDKHGHASLLAKPFRYVQ